MRVRHYDTDRNTEKKNIQEAEAIIVGGASGMSAAAGFRFYYMSDATFKQ